MSMRSNSPARSRRSISRVLDGFASASRIRDIAVRMQARMWVVLALVVGCKSGSKAKEPATTAAGAPAAQLAQVPKVDVASVLAAEMDRAPFVVVVDESGATYVNAVST